MQITNIDSFQAHFLDLAAENPELALRLALIRTMMAQRNITNLEISTYLNKSKSWSTHSLAPANIRTESNQGYQTIAQDKVAVRMDKIEDAITDITELMGGVYKTTGANPGFADEMELEMSSAWQMARREAGGRLA